MCIEGPFPESKVAGAWGRPLISNSWKVWEWVKLYLHSPIHFHSVYKDFSVNYIAGHLVELYFCFPRMPSWRGQGQLCLLPPQRVNEIKLEGESHSYIWKLSAFDCPHERGCLVPPIDSVSNQKQVFVVLSVDNTNRVKSAEQHFSQFLSHISEYICYYWTLGDSHFLIRFVCENWLRY
jgi:hypothetical protein